MKMVEDSFYNRFFIIDVIVSNDGSTKRNFLKHPPKGVCGQVLNSFKGKIDEEIPELSLLVYPSHSVKVLAKHIFSITNWSKDQRCGCTKEDSIWIKKYWGYMDKIIGWRQLKSWVNQVRLLLNTCLTITTIVVQSGDSRQEHQNKERHKTKKTKNSTAKQNNNHLYNLLKKTLFPFRTYDVIKESLHMFDTQKNKSMNNVIVYVAPKNKRVHMAWA